MAKPEGGHAPIGLPIPIWYRAGCVREEHVKLIPRDARLTSISSVRSLIHHFTAQTISSWVCECPCRRRRGNGHFDPAARLRSVRPVDRAPNHPDPLTGGAVSPGRCSAAARWGRSQPPAHTQGWWKLLQDRKPLPPSSLSKCQPRFGGVITKSAEKSRYHRCPLVWSLQANTRGEEPLANYRCAVFCGSLGSRPNSRMPYSRRIFW